jgi:hypothetical protein
MSDNSETYTIKDYLQGISALLSEDALQRVLHRRHIPDTMPLDDLCQKDIELTEAEAYWELTNLATNGGTTKDIDGNWSHSEGGYTVSTTNIAEWRKKYAMLRKKWGQSIDGLSTIRVNSQGMRIWRRK